MKKTVAILDSYLRIPSARIRDIEGMRTRFSAVHKFNGSAVPMYDESLPGYFGMPIYGNFTTRNFSSVVDNRVRGKLIDFKFTSEYRDGQENVIRTFKKYLESGKKGFLLEAAPGFGKTVVLIKMISMIGERTLVVVPRSNLVYQWIERLMDHSSLLAPHIGVVEGGNISWRDSKKKIVVGLVHTLALDRLGPEFKNNFGCVVFDEVDRSVPPLTFSPVVGMFPSLYRIGASATIKRKDGLDVILRSHIGECNIRGSDSNRMKPTVVVHYFSEGSGFVPDIDDMNRRGILISRIANNAKRNALIAKYIKLVYASGRRVLVLSDRTSQLVELRSMINRIHGIPVDRIGFYARSISIGKKKRNIKKKELDKTARSCSVILATYGMFSIGSDIASLSGLIYATPQSSVKQSKGRIERILSGKKSPVLVDIVDTSYTDSVRWAKSRYRQYEKEGLKIRVRR